VTDTLMGLAAFTVVATSLGLWIRAFRRVEIPENRSGFAVAWVVGAALGVAALLGEAGALGRIPAWFAVGTSGILLFTVSISRQKVGDDAIRVGGTIPDFTATDEHGETFNSQSLAGRPVLIKFFRAHW